MSSPRISLRICLWTDLGYPAGTRLFKSPPHPRIAFDFPCTREGMKDAQDAAERLQAYCEKINAQKKKVRLRLQDGKHLAILVAS